ncbi:MAG: hypothetical protein R3C03_01440 [Pirellulaceae bacterium]
MSISEYLRRPLIRRSRFLLTVRDLDTQSWRKIYHRSIQSSFLNAPLKVGMIEDGKLIPMVKTEWGISPSDRIRLANFLVSFDENSPIALRIGVYCEDDPGITA